MNSLERILAAVSCRRPDRTPVIPQLFGHTAVLNGVPLERYGRDGALLATCQLQALRYYGTDAVFAVMDVCVETEAAGSRVRYQSGYYPAVIRPVLAHGTTLPQIPDPRRAGRMPELLKAVAILRSEVADDYLVTGGVLGPMTLTTQLLGMEKALYLAADAPEDFERILDFATEISRSFGLAQIDAGAHVPLLFDPAASPEVVPPQFFREFLFPRLTQLGRAFTAAGSLANWLHIAGRTKDILPYYPQAGFTIANFDYCVSPQEAMAALPHTCLDGNIKPLAFVEATQEEIAAASRSLLDACAHRGGFILSSGCEIPPEARPETIAAMVAAVHSCPS